MEYLAAAERTGQWLLSVAVRGPQGWCRPPQPGASAEVEPGLGWGTAGPVLFFVEAFRTTGDERWLAAARAEPAPGGIRWSLAPAWEAEHPQYRRRYPNFAHGAAGIGFFLARLAQVTGERRFNEASLAATAWIMTTVRTDDDTCAAYHHEPDGTELFTLGWCHGPPGLGWTASRRTWPSPCT